MKATHIRIDYLKNPIGVSFQKPLITWQCQGGVRQSAFRIVFSKEGSPFFDTGKVASSSMRYRLPFPLKSRERIAYVITLWDETDKEGEESEECFFEMGLLQKEDWQAKWISGDYAVSKKKRYPVDYFKKEFELSETKNARLYLSSLGLYEAYLNGKRVGDYVLAPGSTDYRVRVQYDVYDVSSLLHEGKNELVVLLADGWYRGSIGAKGFTYVFGKESKLLAQLEVEKRFVLGSDSTWSWSNDGPLCFADLKDGEVVDARKIPSYQGHAKECAYRGIVSASNNTHVKEREAKEPLSSFLSQTGKKVYRFPNNVAGYVSFKCHAKGGERIHIVLGEMLDEKQDVTLKNIQCVRRGKKTPLQEITYFCKAGENEYKSAFFYGGFQYAYVESEVELSEFKQIAIASEMEQSSSFSCSHPLINVFHENTIRSLLSNSVDIPTDCPTRERMGWTGDSQIIFNTASYLFDYGAFAKKHLHDVYDRQRKDGCLPQIAPYSAEDWFMNVMNGSVGWADVGILIPYRMYLKYGDVGILEEHYANMLRYAHFMIKRCGRPKGLYALYAKPLHLSKANRRYGVNTGQSYGEWAEPSDVKAFSWKDFAEPHPEESMAYTSYVLGLMAKIASLLGKKEDMPLLLEYSEGVKKAYQELVGKPKFTLDTDRQAKLVRPLYMHLLDEKQEEYAKKRLVQALEHYRYRLGTGFLSTPFILDVLSEIDVQLAYRLLENEELPGWLYMAKNNTGTIWEGWEGPNSDKGIASLNHYSKGALVEWLYSGMLGIKVAGENAFLLKPTIGGTLTKAEGAYQSIYGRIALSWEKKGEGVSFLIDVPSNTEAVFEYRGTKKVLGPGHHAFSL